MSRNKNLRFSIYSESKDKSEAESTGHIVGKWKLAWWLISGYFYKGTYVRRKEFEIKIEKVKKTPLKMSWIKE